MGPAALAILVLVPEGFSPSGVELYSAARTSIEDHTAFEVAPYDLFDDNLRRSAVGACATDAACFAALARRSGYEGQRLLVLSAASAPDGTRFAAAKLISRGGELLGRGSRPLADGVDALLEEAFTSARWDQVGALALETQPPGAEAVVAGQTCVTPCRIRRLRPGPVQVELRVAGASVHRAQVLVEPGVMTAFEHTLGIAPAPKLYQRWWFWTALAAVVAAGATTAAVVATRGGGEPDLVCLGNIDC